MCETMGMTVIFFFRVLWLFVEERRLGRGGEGG